MNQIHEDDWADNSWASHSGMYETSAWKDDSPLDPTEIDSSLRTIIEISRENGYTSELIAEMTGLTISQIESL